MRLIPARLDRRRRHFWSHVRRAFFGPTLLALVVAEAHAAAEPQPVATAEAAPDIQPQHNPSGAETPRGPEDSRDVPDYDGRNEPTSVGDVVLWVPRVVLFPLYVVSEYLLRLPLGWLVSTAEEQRWPALLIDFFTFGERQGGIVPTLLVDLGLRPSVGVYAFWNDFLLAKNDLRLRATYGGAGAVQVRLADRFPAGRGTVALGLSYETRPDNVFHGIGREQETRARYYSSTTRAGVAYSVPWVRSSYARFDLSTRHVELDGDRSAQDDPSVNEQVQAGVFESPPGMDQVFRAMDYGAEVVLDSRWPRFPDLELASDHVAPPGHGVRLALRGAVSETLEQSLAPVEALADTWVHYGVSLGGYYDLTGQQRSLGLTAIVDFVDPLGDGSVPLTDLVSLGGERPLRGFLSRELVDRSAAALRLEYRWPVAVWLDGSLQYEAGNVFGKGLTGFELGELRSSYGFGLSAVDARDHNFQVLVAFGTEPYAVGADIDSFRFVFGTTAGF